MICAHLAAQASAAKIADGRGTGLRPMTGDVVCVLECELCGSRGLYLLLEVFATASARVARDALRPTRRWTRLDRRGLHPAAFDFEEERSRVFFFENL